MASLVSESAAPRAVRVPNAPLALEEDLGPCGQNTRVRFSRHDTAIIQKVRMESVERTVLLGCSERKLAFGWNKADKLIRDVLAETAKDTSARIVLRENLEESWLRAQRGLAVEPCLYYDLQFLWRADDARLINLDIDRCFDAEGQRRITSERQRKRSFQLMEMMIVFLRESLETGVVPNSTELLEKS